MQIAIALLPLIAVIGLLATRRAGLLGAGCTGLMLAIVCAAWLAGNVAALPSLLGHATWHAAWIAWQAISVMIGGILLYQVLRHARPDLFEPIAKSPTRITHHQLFAICFLLGPFAESATGFGVGYLITVTLLLRLGMAPTAAAVFAVYSQILVPWGALAIGTTIGAELIDMPRAELGLRSAWLSVPLLICYLVVFQWMCAKLHQRPTLAQGLTDFGWLSALLILLLFANEVLDIELGVLASTAPVLIAHWWVHARHSIRWQQLFAPALPYLALTTLLLLTRAVPNLRDALKAMWVIAPQPSWPEFPVFYHASFWLLLVALGYGLWQLPKHTWPAVMHSALASARVPVLVTLVFMIMAEVMAVAGVPTLIANAWVTATSQFAVAATPVLAIVAGALTGSNASSNALLMLLQVELAHGVGADPWWIATVQNVAGSNATLFSPVRIAMGAALASMIGRESELYAHIWPLIATLFVVLIAASFMVS